MPIVCIPLPTAGSGASNPSDYEGFTYDANGNLTLQRLRSGQTVAMTYDALSRMTSKVFSGGTSQPVYWAYDLVDRVLSQTTGSVSGPGVSWTYDALGRALSETAAGRTLTYAYDAASNRTALTWPDGGSNALTAGYVYEAVNASAKIETWRRHNNESRPHTVLGWVTPQDFASRAGAAPCP